MKTKCKIQNITTGNMPVEDFRTAEKLILSQINQEHCEEEITRPDITVWKDIFKLLFTAAITVAIFILIKFFFSKENVFLSVVMCIFTGMVWCVFNFKRLIITLIILYQKYAPEKIRSACLFKPCCSEYMKLAIEKYGALRGILKGIRRICRCRYPNGGIDEP